MGKCVLTQADKAAQQGLSVPQLRRADVATTGLSKSLLRSQTALAAGAAATMILGSFYSYADAQAVGGTIANPTNNATETIAEVVDYGVITQNDIFILTTIAVGASLPDVEGSGSVQIVAQRVNATTGLIDQVELSDGRLLDVVQTLEAETPSVSDAFVPIPKPGDVNYIRQVFAGDRGSNGRGGAVFVPARGGKDGDRGPDIPGIISDGSGGYTLFEDIPFSNVELGGLAIATVSDGLAGVERSSVGGNGGNGGGSSFNLAGGGKPGGRGGAGGTVSLGLNGGSITTYGEEAHGVVVQSRAGIGGQGGDSFLATGGGGDGGAGNNGGFARLTVDRNTTVNTWGLGSAGVLVQSLGGGAGAGGSAYNLFSWAGGAKDGGDGGTVNLDFAGWVYTRGIGAPGVYAQSLGGTGGQGGDAIGLTAFGDNGSGGGDGGQVYLTLRSTARVRTDGWVSPGVLGQSVGGGGGSTGIAVSLTSFGADGGSGGNGGNVSLALEEGALVDTYGWFSPAVMAQSVGGGGGNGRTSVGLVSLGASGGGGGSAGDVSIISGADITTAGVLSFGLFAQSVGGGGGNASASVGFLALGGDSDDGGDAGNVSVSASGSISTAHALASGIFAQSIGGGGGNGGNAISGGWSGLAIGGDGGGGGDAGRVTVEILDRNVLVGGLPAEVNSAISTMGFLSRGVHLQSVGGGGGNGGMAVQVSANALAAASVAIGGSGGSGGDGELVRLRGDVSIQTEGAGSQGILAQSIGGGGGSGGGSIAVAGAAGPGFAGSVSVSIGGSGGAAGDSLGSLIDVNGDPVSSGGQRAAVFIDSGGLITTSGYRSIGLLAQSVGGGGGTGGFAVSAAVSASDSVAMSTGVGVGGQGGGGGDGGRVDVTFDGTITTYGFQSHGALVQSTGGGGGNGGFTVVGTIAGSGGGSAAIGVGVGGKGAGGGDGSSVSGDFLGPVSTFGNQAYGVVVQSVGGGGGNGGFSVVGGISASGGVAGALGVGVGGFGGGGGDAGDVHVEAVDIVTTGNQSVGLLAQSVGGGGGNGGFNVTGSIAAAQTGSGTLNVGVGGYGGGGGRAGDVTVLVSGDVFTLGAGSDGVIAQSVGGGGGNGAFNVSAGISASSTASGNANVGIGGSGGSGGSAGNVTLTLDTMDANDFISVLAGGLDGIGRGSNAIVAQSVGGGGGNGGFNVSAGIAVSGNVAGNLGLGIGGSGGGGGDAGSVNLFANNLFRAGDGLFALTTADESTGVVAQSVGGGGGAGNFNVTGGVSIAYSDGAAGNLGIGIGGSGGGGGDGANVTVGIAGDIETRGDGSAGFEASSIGGGGGSGGFNVTGGLSASLGQGGAGNLGVGIGGVGGDGGNAGWVSASVRSNVSTLGDEAAAVLFQSVGGGGGSGGFNVTGAVALAAGGSNIAGAGSIGVGIGGFGGAGGNSDIVVAHLDGLIRSTGDDSSALLAQSVGGSGGAGAFNVTGAISLASDWSGSLGFGLGGFGGGGGDAGDVTLRLNQRDELPVGVLAVYTQGHDSPGVAVQSVGGGGGAGGFNVTGGLSFAKDGAGNIGIGVGGSGGDGGNGADATAFITGSVATLGDNSGAVLVQSAGGGGGRGGFNVSGGVAGSQGTAGNLLIGVGGSGGGGGDAGDVRSTTSADYFYAGGTDAFGLTVQSVGGSGGSGGFNVTGGISLNSGQFGAGSGVLGIGVGGMGGAGGNAGWVRAFHDGYIFTEGDGSYGALVQSQGGGGGYGAFNVTGGIALARGNSGALGFGLGGFGGGGGDAGIVFADFAGDMLTTGEQAFGLLVQSAGGGGGAGAFNVTGGMALNSAANTSVGINVGIGGFGGDGGDAGGVTATVAGNYRTEGASADAVVAQSIGGSGGSGSFNVTGGMNFSAGRAGAVSFGLGGFGGDGGNAGSVMLTRLGDTTTIGALSDGLIAQSVGGGGGQGAFNISGQVTITTDLFNKVGGASIGVGGFGGSGGNGGAVSLTVDGDVLASGTAPVEYFEASSLADLADAFGFDLGPNGEGEDIDWSDRVRVLADGSHGVVAQSVGGGGGAGSFNVSGNISGGIEARGLSLGVGGWGGEGGDANLVVVNTLEDHLTFAAAGDNRFALLAQSVGGGGGVGSFNVSGQVASKGNITAGVGGFGGDGGAGGAVLVRASADLYARGNLARGLLAQSIGGGGGAGGFNISSGIAYEPTNEDNTLSFGVGGSGGTGSAASDVDVDHRGRVIVDGLNAGGIMAQSIGGGGGDGGFNVSVNLDAGGFGSSGNNPRTGYAASIGVGGFGGDGSDAADVRVTSEGDILVNSIITEDLETGDLVISATEFRDFNFGLRAQSIGGGGGSGGFNFTGVIANEGKPLAVSVGGNGGSSGSGGDVTVTRGYQSDGGVSPAAIILNGDYSVGLAAESIGGAGGTAGMALLLTGARGNEAAAGTTVTANIIVGGNGGGAGSGGNVLVDHIGHILVSGENTRGLTALSLGGGGGAANLAVGGGYTANTSALNFVIGGAPQAAGAGGGVAVRHAGNISTDGNFSEAVMAQSIGGGGGNVALSMLMVLGADNQVQATLGRDGGTGGEGGDVSVTIGAISDTPEAEPESVLSTLGDNSTALFAQSLGGGGGTSSTSAIDVSRTTNQGSATDEQYHQYGIALGNTGASGGGGGDVTVRSRAHIVTEGQESRGIHAESIGGGGGRGGGAIRPIINATTAVDIAVGGAGGTGGSGGDVEVENSGEISTQGANSQGILAESLGGGGGTGGYIISPDINIDNNILPAASESNSLNINVGGDGGSGADGGHVFVTNSGSVRTDGDNSEGIAARSTGGGGGAGGIAATIRASTSGAGNGLTINVGGSGNSGGLGGLISVRNSGVIHTTGDGSHGVLAHSLGGGGGNAGIVANIDWSNARNATENRNSVAVSIGGSGGAGGHGGSVFVENASRGTEAEPGLIWTEGYQAHGIYARSIGGGGGDGGSVVSMLATNAGTGGSPLSANTQLSVAIGGQGDVGGSGGQVSVVNEGAIVTEGDYSNGILAESIGGGGGSGGFALAGVVSLEARESAPAIAVGGIGGDGGNGGDVIVTNAGEIWTRGTLSHGIVARSIGGGGGASRLGLALTGEPVSLLMSNFVSATIGGATLSNGGSGGDVYIDQRGDVNVTGLFSLGQQVASINGGGGEISFDFTGVNWLAGTPLDNPDPSGDSPSRLVAGMGGNAVTDHGGGRAKTDAEGQFVASGMASTASSSSSIGGGGGVYNLLVDVSSIETDPVLAGLPTEGLGIEITLGGTEGAYNDGGTLEAAHTGLLYAEGLGANAVLDQTIGGGGGRSNVAVDTPSHNSFDLYSVSMGGASGSEERGGSISRYVNGLLATQGQAAIGALLQSVGGGGGYSFAHFEGAGTEALLASAELGAEGGSGLDGGTVSAGFTDHILTSGTAAHGALLQSIGAGGGAITHLGGASLEVEFGAEQDASGNGGNLSLDVTGSILVDGPGSAGAVIQSIGGGGGYVYTDLLADQVTSISRSGGVGDGGDVSVGIGGSVQTLGDMSSGLIATSSGGGGLALFAGEFGHDRTQSGFLVGSASGAGDGGNINFSVAGDVRTAGFGSLGVLAQSAGGDAGVVSGQILGNVITVGDHAHGVLLQGIGGGGGYVAGGLASPVGAQTGGVKGDGGAIDFTVHGHVVTRGEGAHGVVAQSLGGGGWVNDRLSILDTGAGAGGAITLTATGDIIANRRESIAIYAQSIGSNGGGDISSDLSGYVRGGSGAGLGVFFDGGANNVLNTGGTLSAVSGQAITMTTGNDTVNNTGWVVGNIDLGSGLNAFNNQLGSTFMAFNTIDLGGPQPTAPQEPLTVVTGDKGLVQVQDTVSTVSSDKPLVMVQDSSMPAVPVSGVLNADSKGTAQVQDDSVVVNTNSKGFAPVQDGLTTASANAIALPDTVQVQRELTASAPAVSGGTFTNEGTFLMGLSATTRPIDLRAGETFYNLDADGDPLYNIFYGARVVNQVALNGDYVQTADGHLVFDLAYGPYDYDHVTLTGDVTVDGTGDVTFIWLSDNDPTPLFTSTGGTATNNGLEITDTLAVDFSVRAEANRIMLDIETDFGGVDGLNRNERSLGAHMDSNLDVGGAEGTGRLLTWLGNLQDPDLYKYIMTELNPEPHIAVLQGLTNTSLSFSDDLINCGTPSSMRSEEECNWSRMDVGTADRDRSFERFSTQADTFSVRAGFQRPINDTWNAGAAIGYESVNYHDIDGTRAGTNGEGVTLGATINRDFHGGGIFAATLSGGWMKYDTVRLINVFEPQIAESSPEAGYVDLRVRSGLMTEFDNGFYILPRADLSFTNLIHNGFHETGADGIGMRSDGDSDWMITGSPAVEFGWTREYEDGREFRASATFGGRLHSDDYLGLPMSFAEAPAGVIPAMIETQIDQEMYTFDAGFEFLQGDRVNVSFSYRGEYGETTDNHQAGFQVGVRF